MSAEKLMTQILEYSNVAGKLHLRWLFAPWVAPLWRCKKTVRFLFVILLLFHNHNTALNFYYGLGQQESFVFLSRVFRLNYIEIFAAYTIEWCF